MAAARAARYLNGHMTQAGLRADLRAIVGEQGILEGNAVRERAGTLWHGRVDAELLVRPRSTEQVSHRTGAVIIRERFEPARREK